MTDHDAPDRRRLFQTTEPFAAAFPSSGLGVRALREEVEAVARRRGLVGTDLSDVALAVTEAATNSLVHGDQAPGATIRVSVRFDHRDMQVTVSDDGGGMRSLAGRAGGGRGLSIIECVTKDVVYETGAAGTTVRMNFACPARADHASLVRRTRPPTSRQPRAGRPPSRPADRSSVGGTLVRCEQEGTE